MNLLKHDQQYVIEVYPLGLLVSPAFGQRGVPMDALKMASAALLVVTDESEHEKAGMDSGIANSLGGIFAIGTNKNLDAWRKQIADELETQHISKELKWIRGTDCGNSSITLFCHLAHTNFKFHEAILEPMARHTTDGGEKFHPFDADDFGRFVRMIEFLGWHDRLQEARTISKEWDGIIHHWDNFCVLMKDGKLADVSRIIKNPA